MVMGGWSCGSPAAGVVSGNTHIAVQLEPSNTPGRPLQNSQNAINYLNSYFGNAKIKVYWGTCQEFCHDLRTRWEAFKRP
jgi:hypothetical protein